MLAGKFFARVLLLWEFPVLKYECLAGLPTSTIIGSHNIGSHTKKNLKMLDADDKNTFRNCDVLELLSARSYPSDDFGIVAIDKKFRHGLLELL